MDPVVAGARADYADALVAARGPRTFLFAILLLVLLAQIGIFLTVRFAPGYIEARPESALESTAQAVMTPATTQPATRPIMRYDVTRYVLAGTIFVGTMASILYLGMMLLLCMLMVGARALGQARVVSGFVYALLVFVLIFPWQTFLPVPATPAGDPQLEIPGALYMVSELGRVPEWKTGADIKTDILNWVRFAVFPGVVLIFLIMAQTRSGSGLRTALGRNNPDDVTEPIPV